MEIFRGASFQLEVGQCYLNPPRRDASCEEGWQDGQKADQQGFRTMTRRPVGPGVPLRAKRRSDGVSRLFRGTALAAGWEPTGGGGHGSRVPAQGRASLWTDHIASWDPVGSAGRVGLVTFLRREGAPGEGEGDL